MYEPAGYISPADPSRSAESKIFFNGNSFYEKSFHSFAPIMEMKERIQAKAEELFKRFGIRSVTMDDVSNQLGISKKTLYQSYTDKEEIVTAVFDQMIGENKLRCMCDREKAENAIHEVFLAFDSVLQMFEDLNPALLNDLHKYHPNVYVKFNAYKYEFLYNVIRENLQRGVNEEIYRPEIDIEIMTRFRIESCMLPFNTEAFPQSRKNLAGVQKELLDHFLYGLATGKGIKLIQKYKQQRLKQQ
jgi:TetR/AcrR family transcriptional regulator, cholesterol catabolism regulator